MQTVSIIIPVYNLEDVLANTLESVVNQTYKNLQIILVNDGSKDGSADVCEEYAGKDDRIVLINKENGGVSSARNVGLKAATGDYVMFVDGDDLLEVDAVETLLNNILESSSDMCLCSTYFRNDTIKQCAINKIEDNILFNDEIIKLHLCFGVTASMCFSLFRHQKIADVFVDESIHTLEDWKYLFDVFADGVEKVSICRKPVYHYMVREGSVSHSAINDKKMSCFNMTRDVLQTVEEKFPQYSDVAECHDSRLLTHLLVIAAKSDVVEDKYNREFKKIARRLLWKTLKSKYLIKRYKLYVLMIAISPKIYYFSYRFKYKIKGIIKI